MRVIHPLRVDLVHKSIPGVLYMVQGDSNTRAVELHLFSEGSPWSVPALDAVSVAFRKPDNTKGLYEPEYTIEDNKIQVVLSPQVLATYGKVTVCVSLHSSSESTLAVFPFYIEVKQNPYADSLASEDYFDYIHPSITEALQQIENAIQQTLEATHQASTTADVARTAASRANASASAADAAKDAANESARNAASAAEQAESATGNANDKAEQAAAAAQRADIAANGANHAAGLANAAAKGAEQAAKRADTAAQVVDQATQEATTAAASATKAAGEAETAAKAANDAAAEIPGKIAGKLDKPTEQPFVGQILKVQKINPDGTFVVGWDDDGGGTGYRANLYSNVTSNDGYISNTGGIINNSGNGERYTDYIPVVAGDVFTVQVLGIPSGSTYWGATCFYDSDKVVVGSRTTYDFVNDSFKFTVPENVAFVIISFRTYGVARIKIEYGKTATVYDKNPVDLLDEKLTDLKMSTNVFMAGIIPSSTGVPKYDSVVKTFYFGGDTLIINPNEHSEQKYVSMPTATVDCNLGTSAIKIFANLKTRTYRADFYNSSLVENEVLVATVRHAKSVFVSISCPFYIDDKYMGVDTTGFSDKSVQFPNIKSINHRGYNSVAPENTISAFTLSKFHGFEYVETDVRFTSDGVAVLLHDASINRTSNGKGNIAEMTFEQSRLYDFGSWKSSRYAGEQIPSFDEFMMLCKQIGLKGYVELKAGTRDQIIGLVNTARRYRMAGNVSWIGSLQHVRWILEASPNARVGLLSTSLTDEEAGYIKTANNKAFVDCEYRSITNELVNKCIEHDIDLEVWTVDDVDKIKSLDPYVSGVTSDTYVASKLLYHTWGKK